MHIYKLCWKVIRHSFRTIAAYLFLFLVFVILVDRNLFLNMGEQKAVVPVLLINEDKDSELMKLFEDYLGIYVEFSDDEIQNENQLENEMFFDKYECVIRIPKDFTENFINGKAVEITRYHYMESANTVMVETLINQFLSVMRRYYKQGDTLDEMVEHTKESLQNEVDISFEGIECLPNVRFGTYANYMAYVMMSIVLYGTVLILTNLRKEQIQKRNILAPIRTKFIYREVAVAACTGAEVVNLFLIGFGIWLTGTDWSEPAIILICINTFVYAGFCVSVGFVLGMMLKVPKKMEIIERMIALGGSFMGGVFVAQSMLSKGILAVAGLLPTYWYVKINNEIASTDVVRFHDYQQFGIEEGIIICYTLVLFLISYIIAENKVKMDL